MINASGNTGTFIIRNDVETEDKEFKKEDIVISGCTDLLACNYSNYELSDNSSCIYISNNTADIRAGTWTVNFKWEHSQSETKYDNMKFLGNSTNAGIIDDKFSDFEWSMCGNTFKMMSTSRSTTYEGYYSNEEISGSMINATGKTGTFIIRNDVETEDKEFKKEDISTWIIGHWVAYDNDSKIEYSFYEDNSIWIRNSDGSSYTGWYKFYENVNHKLEPWASNYWNCYKCEGNQVSGFTFTSDKNNADMPGPMIAIFTNSNQFLMLYDNKEYYFKK